MIDPVPFEVVDNLGLHLLELATDQVGEELLDVLVLRVGDMRTIVPDKSVLLFAVDMTAVVGIGLVDDAFVVARGNSRLPSR